MTTALRCAQRSVRCVRGWVSKSLDVIRRNLIESGMLRKVGDRYMLTDAGHAECERVI